MQAGAKPPFNPLHYASAAVHAERRSNGEIVLESAHALPEYARCNGEWLERWARLAPDRTFLAERQGQGWRKVGYAQALAAVRALGAALLRRGLSAARPVAVLSDNSVNHGLLAYACQYVGIPVAPISQAYSLMSKDHAKLKAIFALLEPGLVYVGDEARFAASLASLGDFATAPIINLHFWFDRTVAPWPFAAFTGSELQWVFNRDRFDSPALPRRHHVVVSLSAAQTYMALNRRELEERFLPQLRAALPGAGEAELLKFMAIKEPNATFIAAPGLSRPGPGTPIPNLVLAGSYTSTGWPATMESAVRSGLTAARELDVHLRASGEGAIVRAGRV